MNPPLGVGTLFATASLLVLALPIGGQETPDDDASGLDGLMAPSFSRGWRSLLPDLASARPGALHFADEFYLDPEHGWPGAIAYAFDRFFVLTHGCDADPCDRPDRAFAYTPDGRHDPSMGFTLAPNTYWIGATYADGLLYAVGISEDHDRVFAHTAQGERALHAEFDLASNHNYNPHGIVYVDGHFHVVDAGQDDRRPPKVYVYTTAGVRVPALEFELRQPFGGDPLFHEIAYVDGLFYIGMLIGLDYTLDRVQIYRPNGERVGGLRFARTWIDGLTFVNDRFRVLSNFGICAYTLTGERVRQDAGERWCGRRD